MNIRSATLNFFIVLICFLVSAFSYAAPAVAIDCPCSVQRVNSTAVDIDFNLIFTQNARKSGSIEVHLYGHESRNALSGGYYVLASSKIESIPFTAAPSAIRMRLPFYATGFENGYLSLVLVNTTSGEIFDITPLTAQPISISADSGAVFRGELGETFFETKPTLDVADYSYNFSALNFTNRSSPLVSEQLTLQLSASNLSSYYLLDEQEFTVTYDFEGKANLNLQGFSNSSLDGPLSYAPEHKYLQIGLFRAGQQLLSYTLGALDNSPLPDYAFGLNAVDTLTDSDADGVSDYAELLRGSPADSPETDSLAELEVAFLYGDVALEYFGSEVDIEGQLSHLLAVANQAYIDSGLNIRLLRSDLVYMGNDTGLSNNALLNALTDRVWPFRLVDSLLARQPDVIVHLNMLSNIDNNGGVAWVNGQWNDGVIDFEGIAAMGTNTAVVDMDNTALTLVHEVGHLMGLDHSRAQVEGSHYSSFHWALGHGEDAEFVTIMGYSNYFSYAPQIPVFSSPALVCGDLGASCGPPISNLLEGADAVSALKSVAFQWTAIANGYSPTLTLNGSNPLMLEVDAPLIDLGAASFDSEDGDITANVNFNQVLVSDNPDVDYLQTYSVTDSDANTLSIVRRVLLVIDTDNDGIYNRFDSDDDNDGIADIYDQFPQDDRYSVDSDDDGLSDLWEIQFGLDPTNPSDASSDRDDDGYSALQEFAAGIVPVGSLDVDGNGQYDGLTDGMLLLRHMFGYSGEQLINNAVAGDALYKSASAIQVRIDALGDRIDVDNSQHIDALTDGLLILRYLLEYQEGELIDNALSPEGTRLDASSIMIHLDRLKSDH